MPTQFRCPRTSMNRLSKALPALFTVGFFLLGQNAPAATTTATPGPGEPPSVERSFYIKEYRIIGIKSLARAQVDEAVYGFLGPARTPEDVEQARAALEKAYQDAGFQTVSVSIPPQRTDRGVIVLQVSEATVGRLRVKGSRYFDIEEIKRNAPSLAEGKVPNFNEVQRDLISLNTRPDRQITPTVKPGVVPGTVDVDLTVKDNFPLHGALEINNRYSANTTELRLDLSARYDNLWQLGHTLGFGFQIAPENPDDSLVYSGYYIARFPGVDWFSFMLQGTLQYSDVNTLGATNSAGNGEIFGGRFLFNLPSKKDFFHSVSLGQDYKHLTQDITTAGVLAGAPVTYAPFSADYNATWVGKNYETSVNAGIVFSLRGVGSDEKEFDKRRFNSDGGFSYFHGGITHTHELPYGFQLFSEIQGQITGDALVDSEQFSIGGYNTVRGYLESSALGDNGFAGTIEIRSPELMKKLKKSDKYNWRLFAFLDGGIATLNDPLPEQTSQFNLWSYGFGTTLLLHEHFNASLVLGIPQITQEPSKAHDARLTFRLWAEM